MKVSIKEKLNENGVITVDQQLEQQRLENEAKEAAARIAEAEALKVQHAPKLEMTAEQLQSLMGKMIEMSTQAAIAAVQELRKPTEDEQAEKEKKRLQAEREKQLMQELCEEETRNRDNVQRRCPHKKQNGFMNYGGQVHNDGRVRLICKRCMKLLVDRPATSEDHQNGPLELLVENDGTGVAA
jgi:hypothetical protein